MRLCFPKQQNGWKTKCWHGIFSIQPDILRRVEGWNVFDLALFYLDQAPVEGAYVAPANYRGFWLHFRFWLPVIGWRLGLSLKKCKDPASFEQT